MRKRDKKISFWATESEQTRIHRLAGKAGVGEGEYLRLSALGMTIRRIGDLKPLLHELKGIGRNLNQLTMLAHEGRVGVIRLDDTLDCLGRVLAAVNGLYEQAPAGTIVTGHEDTDGDL